MQHDKYDQDILRTLRRIAKSLENIEFRMIGFKEYTTEEYGETHTEWVDLKNMVLNKNEDK